MRKAVFVASAAMVLGLSGCVTDGYYGSSLAFGGSYPYDGYYDGFYGPVYDGYWGNNGYFYYRGSDRDRRFRRGDRAHFYRGPNAPGPGHRAFRGDFRPQRGMRMPSFPHGGRHRR